MSSIWGIFVRFLPLFSPVVPDVCKMNATSDMISIFSALQYKIRTIPIFYPRFCADKKIKRKNRYSKLDSLSTGSQKGFVEIESSIWPSTVKILASIPTFLKLSFNIG